MLLRFFLVERQGAAPKGGGGGMPGNRMGEVSPWVRGALSIVLPCYPLEVLVAGGGHREGKPSSVYPAWEAKQNSSCVWCVVCGAGCGGGAP